MLCFWLLVIALPTPEMLVCNTIPKRLLTARNVAQKNLTTSSSMSQCNNDISLTAFSLHITDTVVSLSVTSTNWLR